MEKVPLFYHSTAKLIFGKCKESNVQSFGGMIKCFVKFSSADNLINFARDINNINNIITDPGAIFLANNFTQIILESSDSTFS